MSCWFLIQNEKEIKNLWVVQWDSYIKFIYKKYHIISYKSMYYQRSPFSIITRNPTRVDIITGNTYSKLKLDFTFISNYIIETKLFFFFLLFDRFNFYRLHVNISKS